MYWEEMDKEKTPEDNMEVQSLRWVSQAEKKPENSDWRSWSQKSETVKTHESEIRETRVFCFVLFYTSSYEICWFRLFKEMKLKLQH